MKKILAIALLVAVYLVGCKGEKNKDYLTDYSKQIIDQEDRNEENRQEGKLDETETAEQRDDQVDTNTEEQNIMEKRIDEVGTNVEDRFLLPEGYKRIQLEEDTFSVYLRKLPLKSHGSKVNYYDGRIKDRQNVYEAVVDMDIGKRDLQQCADAIMRLRGEYLYEKGDYHKIHFNFTNGFRVDYSKWMDGYRVQIDGNKTSFVKKKNPSNTYEDFRKYMEIIFAYAGTLSLSQELEAVPLSNMEIGDVLIQGGSPGHAVIVIDMAIHEETDNKIFMLAQSYMPAQDIQVLCNPNNETMSPWYSLEELRDMGQIRTPEWTFEKNSLKRFSKE